MSRKNFLNNIRPKKNRIKLKWRRFGWQLKYLEDIHRKLYWSIIIKKEANRETGVSEWHIEIYLFKDTYRIKVDSVSSQYKLRDAVREAEKAFAKIRKKF